MSDSPRSDLAHVMSLLRASHDRLAAAVAAMDDAQLSGPSYDAEWTIADVLSHLGSGAEIFGRYVAAGRDGTPLPGTEEIQPIWDAWNAKSPVEQAHDGVAASAALIDLFDSFDAVAAAAWRLDLFGAVRDLVELVSMRVTEQAIHTWDVVVMTDPAATVAADAVDLVIDRLDLIVQYTARPPTQAVEVEVTTEAPARRLRLRASSESVSLRHSDHAPADATLVLPAEAFVRLVYGRLDHLHTAGVHATGVSLDVLRAVFPGP